MIRRLAYIVPVMFVACGPAAAADFSAGTAGDASGLYVFATAGEAMPGALNATQASVNPDEVNAVLSLENGYTGSLGAGFEFGGGLKFEGELGYVKVGTVTLTLPDYMPDPISDAAPGTLSGMFAMANLWYAMPTGPIRPFFGAGIGGASLSIDAGSYFGDKSINDSGSALAWQLGAGIEADFGPDVEFLLRYRYLATDNFTVNDSDGTEITATFDTSIVDAGVRFRF